MHPMANVILLWWRGQSSGLRRWILGTTKGATCRWMIGNGIINPFFHSNALLDYMVLDEGHST